MAAEPRPISDMETKVRHLDGMIDELCDSRIETRQKLCDLAGTLDALVTRVDNSANLNRLSFLDTKLQDLGHTLTARLRVLETDRTDTTIHTRRIGQLDDALDKLTPAILALERLHSELRCGLTTLQNAFANDTLTPRVNELAAIVEQHSERLTDLVANI